jgi:hypothetical protein
MSDTVNFIAGTHAVYWSFSKDGEPSFLESTELLLRYHWGSVVGGSLLQGFFYFIDLILDFIFVILPLFSLAVLPKTIGQQVTTIRRRTGTQLTMNGHLKIEGTAAPTSSI